MSEAGRGRNRGGPLAAGTRRVILRQKEFRMSAYFRLRQICLVTRDMTRSVADFTEIFGVRLAYRDPMVARYGLENALFPFGLAFVEIVAPTRADTAAGRFLDRTGGQGGYMAIFSCDDWARRAARAEALGVPVVQRFDMPDFQGVQLHPRACRAAMIEFDHTPGGQDIRGPYHSAGPDWLAAVKTDVTRGLKEIVLESPDPHDLGAHWARLLEAPYAEQGDGGRIDVETCGVRFAPARDGRESLAAVVVEAARPQAILDAAARRGCAVDDAGFTLCGVRFRVAG
jgi:catechol 2,3-dioxygenase-like lactoylglutathione lyase family enzyme